MSFEAGTIVTQPSKELFRQAVVAAVRERLIEDLRKLGIITPEAKIEKINQLQEPKTLTSTFSGLEERITPNIISMMGQHCNTLGLRTTPEEQKAMLDSVYASAKAVLEDVILTRDAKPSEELTT